MQRSFKGEAGRPVGTVVALACLVLSIAAMVLGRVAYRIIGASTPIDLDPALLQRAQDYWGLFLAGEIVKVVTGCAILLAVWTLAGAVGPRTPRRRATLAIGTLGALLFIAASRQGIVASAHLGMMDIIPFGWLVGIAGRVGIAGIGLWAALLALEARRAQSLPRWVQDCGFALCVAAQVSAAAPSLLIVTVAVSFAWWAGLFATLYRPEDRIAR